MTKDGVHKKVNRLFQEVISEGRVMEQNDPTRVKSLRVSSFPFCAVQWFLSLPNRTSKASALDASFKFYVSVGHAVHDTLQKLLTTLDMSALKAEMIADWRCLACKKKHYGNRDIGMHVMQVQPSKCEVCGGDKFEFHEVTVKYKNIVGHVDTIFEITLNKPTKAYPEGKAWIVVDYKTAKMKNMGTDHMASHHNKSQIRAYVALLKKLGKPVVPFAALIYVPREDLKHFQVKVVSVDFEKMYPKIENYIKQFKQAVRVRAKSDLIPIVEDRPCSEKCLKQFEWCQWRGMCAGEENEEVILRELNNIRKVMLPRLPIKDWQP